MKESTRNTILELRDASCRFLSERLQQALGDALIAIAGGIVPCHYRDGGLLRDAQTDVINAFTREIIKGFDELIEGHDSSAVNLDGNGLSIVDDDKLESEIALEGMVKHARNCDLTEHLRFTTRLNSLLTNIEIDESNDPLDPAQIGEAIKLAILPLGMSSNGYLTVYRKFNQHIFQQFELILEQANQLLIARGILPELQISGRNKDDMRTRQGYGGESDRAEDRKFSIQTDAQNQVSNRQQVFSLLQSLLHDDPHKKAMSSHVHDTIEISDLLFQAIWDDETVPEPIRQLVGRTSFSVLKIALDDNSFWENPRHPARALLNEVANIGNTLLLSEEIEGSPLYNKAGEIINRMAFQCEGDKRLISKLLQELVEYHHQHPAGNRQSQPASEENSNKICETRRAQASAYATRKLTECIPRHGVPQSVRQFLEGQFKTYLVEVFLAKGPCAESWKPIRNTIDLLLWSVKPDKSEEDKQKLEKINPRLISNLEKALQIARVNSVESTVLLRQLHAAQQSSFEPALEREEESNETAHTSGSSEEPPVKDDFDQPVNLRSIKAVEKLPVGIWLEFIVDRSHSIRCTLAARITAPDRLIFVNHQGVKVVEKTLEGLAQEIQAGTARVVADTTLIDRAIDTVIARLRARNGKTEQKGAA